MTTPEQRVEEALECALNHHTTGGDPCAYILGPEVVRLRKELSSAMETFAHEMSLKQNEIDGETGRHNFTIAKWQQERKELTDALVGTRAEIAALKEQLRTLNLLLEGKEHRIGQYGAIGRCTLCGCCGPHYCTGAKITSSIDGASMWGKLP